MFDDIFYGRLKRCVLCLMFLAGKRESFNFESIFNSPPLSPGNIEKKNVITLWHIKTKSFQPTKDIIIPF